MFARAEDAAAAFDASVRASGGQVVNFPQPGTAEVEAVFGESAENTLRKKRRADGDAWAPPARRAPAAVSRGTSHALPGGGGFLARAASAPSPSLFLPPALRPPAAAVSSHGAQAAAHAAARGVREGHGGGGGASRGTAAQAPLPPPRKARSSSPPETAPLLSAVAAALAGGLGATNGPTGGPTGAMSGGGTHAAFSALGSIHLSQRSAAAAGNNAGVGTGVGVPTTSAPSGCALPFSDAAVAAEQRRGFTSAERSAPNQHAAAYAAHPASLVRLAVPTLSSGAAATQTQGAAAGDANSPGAAASNAATHPFSTSAAAAAPPRPTSAEWEFTLKAVPTIPHSAAATLRGAGPSGGVATSASGSALVSPPSVGALCGSGDGSMQRQMSSAGAAPMRASPPRPAPAAPLAACDSASLLLLNLLLDLFLDRADSPADPVTPEAFFLCGLRPPIADAAAVLAAMMSGSLRLAHLQAAAADSFGDRQQPPHDADPVPPPPRSAAWRDLLARLRVTDAGDAATLLKAVLASQSNIATHMVCE